jgi:hypothetical protein
VTYGIQHFEKEITRNPADLDLFDTSSEVFPHSSCKKVGIYRIQADCVHEFNTIPAFI